MAEEKSRSPAYPALDLGEAVEKAERMWENSKDKFIPVESAIIDWGYKSKTGTGAVIVAALRYYGLIQDQGIGEARKIGLTELAKKIVLDKQPESLERKKALYESALNPKVFRTLWELYPGGKVSDATLTTILMRDLKFYDDGAKGVIKNFRKTIEFASLNDENVLNFNQQPFTNDSKPVEGAMMTSVAMNSETQNTSQIQTSRMEFPYVLRGKQTKFAIEFPSPMNKSEWGKLKDKMSLFLDDFFLDADEQKNDN
jgi:hypothetical protein